MHARFYELLRLLLRLHEGCSLRAYKDTKGKYTIGYGRNLTDRGVPADIARKMRCTIVEAEAWLQEDISAMLPRLIDGLARDYDLPFDTLYVNQQLVLADMAYCMGVGTRKTGDGKEGLLDFRIMLTALKDGNHLKAAAEILDSDFARDTKTRAVRLADMMRGGQLPPELRPR